MHLIKEFYPSGAVSELLHLKVMRVVDRVRIKELEHLISDREQSAAVSYPGNSESEPSDSESTTGDSQGLHSLRSAACGGGSGGVLSSLNGRMIGGVGCGCMLLLELTGTR